MTRTHVLHIPKTGGTALLSALAPHADAAGLVLHDHFARLADVPPGERAVFAVRDPAERFVSGFNSRLRKGMPRNYFEWTPVLREGFERFPTANRLAEAISDADPARRRQAMLLIGNIFHIGTPLSYWLGAPEYLEARTADVLMVLRQAELNDDFERLKSVLGIPGDVRLPSDPVGAHVTPPGYDTGLSALARANLAAWYAGDYACYEAALNAGARAASRNAAATEPR